MLRTIAPSREEQDQLNARFRIAQDGPVPEDLSARQEAQRGIRGLILDAAQEIEVSVENSREKSLALTHLEEALMWTGKSIFS